MKEKTRFAVVAVVSATAGVVVTSLIDRLAMKQDLEFLGIVHQQVQEGVREFQKKVEGEDQNGSNDE
jgi:hypothetical protein